MHLCALNEETYFSHTNLIHCFLEPSRINLNYLEQGILLDCLSGLLALKICELMSVADISTSIHLNGLIYRKVVGIYSEAKKTCVPHYRPALNLFHPLSMRLLSFFWKTYQNLLDILFKFSDKVHIFLEGHRFDIYYISSYCPGWSRLVQTCANLFVLIKTCLTLKLFLVLFSNIFKTRKFL